VVVVSASPRFLLQLAVRRNDTMFAEPCSRHDMTLVITSALL
jgi:hypothetical protein